MKKLCYQKAKASMLVFVFIAYAFNKLLLPIFLSLHLSAFLIALNYIEKSSHLAVIVFSVMELKG